jgi:integrase
MAAHRNSAFGGAKTVLTEASIRAATPGTLWDGSLKGFGVRVGKNRKTFIVLVASGRRKAIGTWPLLSLASARAEAKRLLAEKTLGKVRPTHTAFDDAKADYLAHCAERVRAGTMKPRTLKDYTRLLTFFPFGRQSVADITARDIIQRLKPLAPSERHHAFTAARRFFRYSVQNHIIDRSPMENMAQPARGISRERVLTEEELQAVYRTAREGATHFHRITALLCITGQRKSEIAHLEWEWLEDDLVTLPSWLTKNKRTHTFPIGPEAQLVIKSIPRLLGNPYLFPAARERVKGKPATVFNGFSKAKAAFDRECGVNGWQLHDLRRTYSSNMAALGIPQIVVEKLLNHVSGGTQSPIAQVYNRYSYMQEMRAAVLTTSIAKP